MVRLFLVRTGLICLGILLLPVGATLFVLLSPLLLGLFLLFIVLPNAYAIQFLGWAGARPRASRLHQHVVDEAGPGEPDGEGEEDRGVGREKRLEGLGPDHRDVVQRRRRRRGDAGADPAP